MKKRIFSVFLAVALLFSNMIGAISFKANAAEEDFSVEVMVQTPEGMMVKGTSTKANAYEALAEVLTKNNIELPKDPNYITEINGIKNNSNNNGYYWMYTVNTGTGYDEKVGEIGVNKYNLQNGDKFIMYYTNFTDSMLLANNIKLSTKMPNSPLEISISSSTFFGEVNLKDIDVKIDGKTYEFNSGKVKVDNGLGLGKHNLEIKNIDNNGKVIEDSFYFELGYPNVNVRVEGLNDTLVEGKAQGKNALDIVEKVLKQNNIQYEPDVQPWGTIIKSIGDYANGLFNGQGGWMYYVKNSKQVISPLVSMDNYIPEENDYIILYLTDFNVPYVNKIKFTPDVVKSEESFKMKFSYVDYTSKDNAIGKAVVTIDGLNYITDEQGEISVPGLSLGQHSYKISGYNGNKPSIVVMDKGVFTIDNINSPSLDYSDAGYDSRDNSNLEKDIDKALNNAETLIQDSTGDLWPLVSLKKLGLKQNLDFLKDTAKEIEEYGIKDYNNTDLEKIIIGLTASGYNPYNFAGYDLVKELYSRDIDSFLVNDIIFALITYNYANIKNSYNVTEEVLIQQLLSKTLTYKLEDGSSITGWALSGTQINPDITGIAINALSKYYDREEVKNVVDNAVLSLSRLQDESGYISDNFGTFSESLSFVILGLTSVGVNPEGALFTKNKGDIVSALFSFITDKGQFKHSLNGKGDYIATEQAVRALIALKDFKKYGKYNFYDNSIDVSKLTVFSTLPKTGARYDFNLAVLSGCALISLGYFLATKKETQI